MGGGLQTLRVGGGPRTLRVGAWLALAALGACAPPQPDNAARIDQLMGSYSGAVPGASVLVLREGLPLFRRAYGYADLEQRTAATPATNYRLASMTKQFTAAAILALVQDGRLRLDDSVRQWLPSLPPADAAVTIRQLLTHTSGLVDYEDLIPAAATQQVHDADVLHLLESQDHGYFTPGTSYRYSNTGYALLALIVARASGRDFASFLRERIFLPLGMRDTVAYEAGHLQRRPPGFWLQLRALGVAAYRPEHHQRGARRWWCVFLGRRSGPVGCGALRDGAAVRAEPAPRIHAGDGDR